MRGDDPARREIWSGGLAIFRDHPLTGCGPDTFHLAFEPKRTAAYWRLEWNTTPARAHNEVIQVLATQGGLGGLALLVLLAGLAVAAVRAWRASTPESRGLVAAACAGVLAFCVQDLFNFTLAPVGTLFVTLAAVLSALGRSQSAADMAPAGRQVFAVLIGLAALGGVLAVAVNTAEGSDARLWWTCCGLLATAAIAAVWAVARLAPAAGRICNPADRSTDGSPIRPAFWLLWGARAAVLAVTVLLAVKCVVEPYQAALACRAGDVALASGESAVDDYQQAVALAPHQEVGWMKLAGAAQLAARNAATPEERRGLFGLARRATDEVLRLEPSNACGHANRGALLTEMAAQGLADPDEALAEFDRATAADPNNAWILATAGQSALMLGRSANARDYFTRGLVIDPDCARLRAGLGALALAAKHFGEARGLLEEAYAADWHGDQEAWINGLQGLALAHLATGDLGHCEELTRSMVSQWPDRTEPHLIHARALEMLGLPDKALAEYRRALVLAPQNVPARNGVGRLEAVVRGAGGGPARATAAGPPPR